MKAIIFDMDGVIIDSEPFHEKIERGLLEEFGEFISAEEYSSFIGTTDKHIWSTLKEKYDLEPSVEELITMKKKKLMKIIHEIPLMSGFKEVLEYFYERNYKIALASSNSRRAVDHMIKQFNLEKYFIVTMSGNDIIHSKPHPEIFLKTAKKLNVRPNECLVFEDAANGIKAAESAGMKCIALDNPNSKKQDLSKADLIINNFEDFDIKRILDNLSYYS